MYYLLKRCMNSNWQHEFYSVGYWIMLYIVGKVHSQKQRSLNTEEINKIWKFISHIFIVVLSIIRCSENLLCFMLTNPVWLTAEFRGQVVFLSSRSWAYTSLPINLKHAQICWLPSRQRRAVGDTTHVMSAICLNYFC